MKRILSLLAAVMLTILTACGGQTQNLAVSTSPSDTSPVTQTATSPTAPPTTLPPSSYSQPDRPDLTMHVYPIGKVTSDLSIFPDLPRRVEITFEIME